MAMSYIYGQGCYHRTWDDTNRSKGCEATVSAKIWVTNGNARYIHPTVSEIWVPKFWTQFVARIKQVKISNMYRCALMGLGINITTKHMTASAVKKQPWRLWKIISIHWEKFLQLQLHHVPQNLRHILLGGLHAIWPQPCISWTYGIYGICVWVMLPEIPGQLLPISCGPINSDMISWSGALGWAGPLSSWIKIYRW